MKNKIVACMIGLSLSVGVPAAALAEEVETDKKQSSISSDQSFVAQFRHVIAKLLVSIPGVADYDHYRAIKFGPATADEANACREKHGLNGPHADVPEHTLKLDCATKEITQEEVNNAIDDVLPIKLSS